MVSIRKPKNALKFSSPASWWGSTWRDGLVAGNGITGISVQGGACRDTVMITHADLWWQGYVGVLQDVSDKLKDVRKKMEERQFKDAEKIISNALITKGYRPKPAYPMPVCDFNVTMPLDRPAKEYARILNMENGELAVTYKDGATRFERSAFVSRERDIICYEITKAGQKSIDATFSFDLHERFNARTPVAVSKLPEGVNIKYENYFMYFSARSDNGTEFGAVAFINHFGGSQVVKPDGITISGAEKVLILIKPFVESQREKEWKDLKTRLSSVKLPYDKLLKEHTPLHSRIMGSAEIDLSAEGRDGFVNDMLNDAFVSGELSTALLEKLWTFGRYLFVCSTSPGGQPMPPYGIWCGDYKAVDAQIDASGALQMMYSFALSGNLSEFMNSVFVMYESVMDDLRKNASRLFGCRGIFVPYTCARGTGVPALVEEKLLHFTAAAGWIAQMFYDYYLYTDDVKFLKTRALPFMKETATFYEEFFKIRDNVYESCPSYSVSPEASDYSNNIDERLRIGSNALIDFAVAKELLKNLIEGSKTAGMNKAEIPKWEDMLTRMPEYMFNSDGTVKEYVDNTSPDNPGASGTAIFYPVYPGNEYFNMDSKAFSMTAKKKLEKASEYLNAQSLGRYANIFSRLGEGDNAMDAITMIVRSAMMSNLTATAGDWRGMSNGKREMWAQPRLEANLAITGALIEMLVQSSSDTIKLLPAVSSNLKSGSVSGILTRANVEVVSLDWDLSKGTLIAKLKAKRATTVNIGLPKNFKRFKKIGAEKADAEQGLVTDLQLAAGKLVTLDVKL